MECSNQTVFVGLSGGVDSSVAALRLKEKGYIVVGVFIKVWHPEFLECNWEQERLDAMRVAAHLDIPFLTCNAEDAYKKGVADYFIESYQMGITPNPDVLCNQQVKFGAFLKFARSHGADFIATGHYAQTTAEKKSHMLLRGIDADKDQTYFLWTLTQEQLRSVLFPIGDTTKDIIRKEAQRARIPVAAKADSQGVCFLGHIDIADFLSHYIKLTPGAVLDRKGVIIGDHKGALVYTNGQRHGFTLTTDTENQAPRYVVERNIEKNTITVAAEKVLLDGDANELHLENVNWISSQLDTNQAIQFQIRYRQTPLTGVLTAFDVEKETATIKPDEPMEVPAQGQSCVFYNNTECFGGGTIGSEKV